MIIKYLKEGFFKNPEQARAARAKDAKISNAEQIASTATALFETSLLPICDKALLQGEGANRVKKVRISGDDIILDIDYVGRDLFNPSTFLGKSFIKEGISNNVNCEMYLSSRNDLDKVMQAEVEHLQDIVKKSIAKYVAQEYEDSTDDKNDLFYKLLLEKNIKLGKIYVFSWYNDVSIKAKENIVASYMPEEFSKNKQFNLITEDSYKSYDSCTEEEIQKAAKIFLKYFIPNNSGQLAFKVNSYTISHITTPKDNEKYLKTIVKSVASFILDDFYNILAKIQYNARLDYEMVSKMIPPEQEEKPVDLDTNDYNVLYFNKAKLTVVKKDYETSTYLKSLYEDYLEKEGKILEKGTFKIINSGVAYRDTIDYVVDKRTGELTKTYENMKPFGTRYLRYGGRSPKLTGVMWINYTTEGKYNECLCFEPFLSELGWFAIGSKEKTIKNFKDFWKKLGYDDNEIKDIYDDSYTGKYSEIIKHLGTDKNIPNSNAFSGRAKYKASSLDWKNVKDIIENKLMLI